MPLHRRFHPVLAALFALPMAASQAYTVLTIHNQTGVTLAIREPAPARPWEPLPPNQRFLPRLLNHGERASFRLVLGGRTLEAEISIRRLAGDGAICIEELEIKPLEARFIPVRPTPQLAD